MKKKKTEKQKPNEGNGMSKRQRTKEKKNENFHLNTFYIKMGKKKLCFINKTMEIHSSAAKQCTKKENIWNYFLCK